MHRYLPVAALLTITLLFIGFGGLDLLSFDALNRHFATVAGFAQAQPIPFMAAHCLAVVALMALALPGASVLTIAAGALLGPWIAMPLTVIGQSLGSCILFAAARLAVGSDWVQAARSVGEQIRAGFQRDPMTTAIFLRLVPVIPAGAMTLALAWLRAPWPVFVVSTVIGAVPANIAIAYIGHGLSQQLRAGVPVSAQLLASPQVLIPLACFALLSAAPMVMRRRQPAATSISDKGD